MNHWLKPAGWLTLTVAVVAPLVALILADLDTAANVAQIVSLPLAVLSLPGVLGPRQNRGDKPPNGRRWRSKPVLDALPVLILVVGLVWAGFVYRAQGSPVAPAAPAVSQGTSDTPAPTANPGGFGPRTEQTLWLETFDSDQLDPDRWRPVNNPQVVRPEGGRLNFVGRRSTSDPPINHDRIQPILPGWPIAEVSGKVTVHQAGGPRDGGITVFVAQKSGRTTGFAFGPSASRPVGEAWVCHKVTSCGVDYGNYVHAGNFPLKPDADNDFAIVQSGESVEVRAGGIVSRADPDPSPIAELWFSLDVAPADDWVATLDDLRVTRAT